MSGNPGPTPGNRGPAPREVTYIESDDEIRQAIQARQAIQQAPLAPRPAVAPPLARPVTPGVPVAPPPVLDAETQTERPIERPPMALLCIHDDGKGAGEWVRVRAERTVIGRTEGDVRILHDPMISGRHAELRRTLAGSNWVWFLTDLKSTNGTFVRVGKIVLRDQKEFLIGRSRYRFEAVSPGGPQAGPGETVAWSGDFGSRALVPALVEVTASGPGHRIPLTLPEYWIGRDARTCAIARPDDLLVNARHARLSRDAQGQWLLQNNKSLNGLWERLGDQVKLTAKCWFRLGEQLFQFQEL